MKADGNKSDKQHSIIYIDQLSQLNQNILDINNAIENNGYILIRGLKPKQYDLLYLASYFGEIQKHNRSNNLGVVDLKPSKETEKQYSFKHHSTSSKFVMPHTDGVYLDGLIKHGKHVVQIKPPKLLLLQCVVPCQSQGKTILVDGEVILNSILQNDIKLANRFLTQIKMTFFRKEQIAMNKYIFARKDNNYLSLRYRFDETCFCSKDNYEALKSFHYQYVMNRKFHQNLSLIEGDILIVDNLRMLHGREPLSNYDHKRHLRRAWIVNDNSNRIVGISNNDPSFFSNYLPYGIVNTKIKKKKNPLLINTGIKMPTNKTKD